VLKSFWDSSTQARREQIIFHELGHCILSRSHTSNKDSGEEPLSIMYPTIFDDYHYTLNHSYYIHELFLD
jgi:hypothetical protein